jgi:glyoxylase-like metal-dependent hydrolase (beta-lactamase superfamily II)
MNRIYTAALSAALISVAGIAVAQQPQMDVAVRTTDLGNRTYMLEGMGGNVTVAVADDGIIMVDAQFANMHDKLKAAIEAVSKQPIKYLINTHLHGDHTGGDAGFAKLGATVTAHENVRKRLASGFSNGLTGATTAAVTGDALPTKTYKNWFTLRLKGRQADVKHFPGAHTDGDTYVYFADANVLATGDIVSVGNRYPNIDFANGGHIDGMIKAVDTYIKLSNDRTKIVPGHGGLMNKAQVIEYRKMLADSRDKVKKLIAEGKSEADAVAAKPFAGDIETRTGANETASANFVRVIYNSYKPKKM